MSPTINGNAAALDAVGGQVFTRVIEHTFEKRLFLVM
jgi:hypothetical protein